MVQVNVHQAKTQLSELLKQVENGQTITIARAGKPAADLVPHRHTNIKWDILAGQIHWDEDTFDDEDPELNDLFEGAQS